MGRKIQTFSLMASLALLTSCATKNKSLLDFDKYKNLNIEEIVKIDVDWDIGDDRPIEFLIEDKNDVDTILNLFCKKDAFVYSNNDKFDGNLSILTLVDKNNTESKVSLSAIYDGSHTYVYTDKTIFNSVYEIGIKLGALS